MTTPTPAAGSPSEGAPAGVVKDRFHILKLVLQHVSTLTAAILFYYCVPIDDAEHPVWRSGLFVVGLAVLVFLIAVQLRKQLAAGSNPGVKIRSLIILLYPVVVLFALTYYVIHLTDPTQFVDLETRTDSLYYTVITLGTVGYGDVHAAGQLARIVSMIQVAFDLVVIGALIAVATSRFQVVPRTAHVGRRHKSGTDSQPT